MAIGSKSAGRLRRSSYEFRTYMSYPAWISCCKIAAEDITSTYTSLMEGGREPPDPYASDGSRVLYAGIDAEMKYPKPWSRIR